MKRKTNLFYTSGPDSNFLTFSNYTEMLTGNFLSSNYKMFPSKFLCLYIPRLETPVGTTINHLSTKEEFIKYYLTGYYENKLAFLREDTYLQKKTVEASIYPLEYLLDTIYMYDKTTSITYVGSITEQDYNGTYTDNICIIDMYDYKYGTMNIMTEDKLQLTNVEYKLDDNEWLVGWHWHTNSSTMLNDIMYECNDNDIQYNELYGTGYEDINLYEHADKFYDITDDYTEVKLAKGGAAEPESVIDISYFTKQYTYETKFIDLDKPITVTRRDTIINELKFNCIIPLFDIVEINKDTNSIQIIDDQSVVQSIFKEEYIIRNIPFGIWLNDPVILKKDPDSNKFPSWSLVISSQFKALPYFNGINNTVESNDNLVNEYATFAQILSRQNSVLNQFNDISQSVIQLTESINKLKERINTIESIISNSSKHNDKIDTKTNIFDRFESDMLKYQLKMNNQFKEFTDEVRANIKNMTWQVSK